MPTRRLVFLVAVLLAAANAHADILFTWDPVEAADGYRFYCAPTPVGPGPFAPLGEVSAPTVTFDATAGLPVAVQSECWVTAFNTDSESADSNHVSLTNPGPFVVTYTLTPPAQVTVQITRTVE